MSQVAHLDAAENADATEADPTEADVPTADAPTVDAQEAEAIKAEAPAPATENAEEEAADSAEPSANASRNLLGRVTPGKTTDGQLIAEWGDPASSAETEQGEAHLYQIEPYERVDVLVEEDVVALIRVKTTEPQTPDKLAEQLQTGNDEPIDVIDPKTGDVLAVVYPEKCLMLLLDPVDAAGTPDAPLLVSRFVITRPDAEAFALRAESRSAAAVEKRLADLEQAMEINPDYGYAPYLAAGLYLSTGQVERAAEVAAAAVEADPENPAYLLQQAQVWVEQGEYDKAVLATRKVLDTQKGESVVKAAALHTMGLLAGFGDARISDKAIAFHTQAITMADRIATTSDDKDRRAAKRLLIEAHLAIAKEVSRRDYDQKIDVVAQWVGRASSLAEEMVSNDRGGLELRLLVARDALAALANLKPAKDPQPWIDEATETANAILNETKDPLMTARVEWMLGETYYNALRVEHTRGRADKAADNGQKAIGHLMAGAASGDIRPSAERLVGRLYFHLGAVNAVHLQDHEKAAEWYDKALPLLMSDAPESKLYVPRRRGEALVSMAVSYWNQDLKDQAIELTEEGAKLMQNAVKAGVLDEKSLGVPYGNLATMHRRLGNEDQSSKFARLARSARGAIATASRPTPPSSPTAQAEAQTRAEASKPSTRPTAPRRRPARGRRTAVR